MKAIMVMYDSLNRHMLSAYNKDTFVKTPNFDRLAERSVTFRNSFVGSMPCMPARREIHSGRYNFLHRSWGPLEPFDDSMPELLKKNGVYSHLVSDHYHYWEEGGCNYHTKYNSWEICRGQEGDPWKGNLTDEIPVPENYVKKTSYQERTIRQDWVNRHYMGEEGSQSQAKTFAKGLEFIETNKDEDNWFLTIETFDPHEPFFSLQKYKDMYEHEYDGAFFDWPGYGPVGESSEEVEHCRYEYAALVSMCDEQLGKVLDAMDAHGLWEDTMLIVNTDHGFLLGEHGAWAKCWLPFYNEIAHTPLFVWDPRSAKRGQGRDCLVQTIDLAPTILEYFGVEKPDDMLGKCLRNAIDAEETVHDAVLFWIHGGHVNCTDGRYVYMRAPASEANEPLYEYTLMPTHMREAFSVDEFADMSLARPFAFMKGCQTMKIKASVKQDWVSLTP